MTDIDFQIEKLKEQMYQLELDLKAQIEADENVENHANYIDSHREQLTSILDQLDKLLREQMENVVVTELPQKDEVDINAMTKGELISEAKKLGLGAIASMTKADLVRMIGEAYGN
jgi:reverse gyrase